LRGSRRSLRRAQSWRWETPDVDATVAHEHARQRWDEARAKAIAWAIEVANDPRVVYLDTETTGFGTRAEIVDIAVVDASGQVLLESLVRPANRIPADVIAIHGITDADVSGAPTWCDLYQDVLRVLTGRRVVVYNVTFDRQMVDQACGRFALAAPTAEWECAMKKYAGFHGNWDARKHWYRFQKLERAVLAFGAEPGGHRAAADALACRTVVLGMAATQPPTAAPETVPARLQQESLPPLAEFPQQRQTARSGKSSKTNAVDPLARWAESARVFLEVIEGISPELRERPGACGSWSAREVAAHCAGWEWEGARRLRLIAADPAIADAVYDVEAFNAASVAVRARQGWTATLDDLARGSAALGAAAAAIPNNARAHEWLTARAADFDDHAHGLRQWLTGAAPMPGAGRLRERYRRSRGVALDLENRDSLA
jgi:DNA polymerase III epsilon subunit-like protein